MPHAATERIGHDPSHAVQLMVAGEQELLLSGLVALVVLDLDDMDEMLEQVQHAVPCPHLLPQVGRGKALPRWRIASAEVVSLIERQETRLAAPQLRGDVLQGRINGEVPQAA